MVNLLIFRHQGLSSEKMEKTSSLARINPADLLESQSSSERVFLIRNCALAYPLCWICFRQPAMVFAFELNYLCGTRQANCGSQKHRNRNNE